MQLLAHRCEAIEKANEAINEAKAEAAAATMEAEAAASAQAEAATAQATEDAANAKEAMAPCSLHQPSPPTPRSPLQGWSHLFTEHS